MGEHKGWTVRASRNGKVRADVLIPGTGKYRSRSFPAEMKAQAKSWAKNEAAAVLVGALPKETLALKPVNTAAVVKTYIEGKRSRGRSPAHLANLQRTLDALAAEVPELSSNAAPWMIETWLARLGRKGKDYVSPATRNRMLVEVRGLCRWVLRHDLMAKDPTRLLEQVAVPKKLKPQFTVSELVHLLALPTPDPGYHKRFASMTYGGLRADEAAPLGWPVIDTVSKQVTVKKHPGRRLKGEKERLVPLQREWAAILGPPGKGAISTIKDQKNERRAFAAYLEACGIPKAGRSPHSCRHTYAALMTASGVSAHLLAEYMGHGSTGTTKEYAKLAARHVSIVAGWDRGEFHLIPLPPPDAPLI